MSDLHTKKCIPCDGGIPGFDINEIHKYLKMVDGWEVKADEDKVYYLIKNFKFKHGKKYLLPDDRIIIACYHPSPRNINTKVVTRKMITNLFVEAKKIAKF